MHFTHYKLGFFKCLVEYMLHNPVLRLIEQLFVHSPTLNSSCSIYKENDGVFLYVVSNHILFI